MALKFVPIFVFGTQENQKEKLFNHLNTGNQVPSTILVSAQDFCISNSDYVS